MTTQHILDLIKLHFRLNWKRITVALVLLIGFLFMCYARESYLSGHEDVRIEQIIKQLRETCFAVMITIGFIYTIYSTFRGYDNKRMVTTTLLMPASTESKYIAEWICTFLILPLTMIALWLVAETISLWFNVGMTSFSIPLSEDVYKYDGFLSFWAIAHSIAFFVRSAGRKWYILLSIAAGLAILQLPIHYSYPFQNIMSDSHVYMNGSHFVSRYPVSIFSEQMGCVVSVFFTLTLPIAMYVLGYLRLKVREL